jgi:hypothetical protein
MFLDYDLHIYWNGYLFQFYLTDSLVSSLRLRAQSSVKEEKTNHHLALFCVLGATAVNSFESCGPGMFPLLSQASPGAANIQA